MEAKRKRPPLSDCTNTTSSSSSSIQKPSTNPSVTTAIKRLLNSINGETVINSNSKPGSTATAFIENSCQVAARIASTPAKTPRVSGTSGKICFVEPCSVYSRRKTANRRKSKGNALAVPLTGSREASINTAEDKNKEDGDTVLSKSSTAHQRKKKKRDPQHALSQNFIEKQRAYFAEIDAFELSEEEVESADQLE